MLLYNLRLGWWNTALSPSAPQATSNANETTYERILNHIRFLMFDEGCDFLAICEISSADVLILRKNLLKSDIEVLNLANEIGRSRFDIAVIYKPQKIKIEHIKSLSKPITGNTVKAAQEVKLTNIDDGRFICVYLCHWASRLNGDGESKRNIAAEIIKYAAQNHLIDDNHVIIMGDFNDNPYDDSLIKKLNASYCLDTVRKYPKEFFYNPFWRTLVSEHKYSHVATKATTYISGTHKHKQFSGTLWHSYDQMLFSGNFINNNYWHLNEFATKIVTSEKILDDYSDKSVFIDHLPIICEITRN
jgi:Endonuclease/Exonuclease/phosphatase family.